MFGRSKPPTNTSARSRRSRFRISRRVASSAVAVSAMRGTPGKRSASAESCRYSRPEVVSPLGDAVRLVDGDEGQVDLVEERKGPLTQQPLGSHVEQVDASGTQPRLDVEHLAVVECRVEARRAHPRPATAS